MEKLQLGVAYHGNRLLKHVKEDMEDIAAHNMNLVVHVFTHNDMEREKKVMKEIFDVTKDNGLDIWVDNWGLGGLPGEMSHIHAYYPDIHQRFSNGEINPLGVCFNSDDYVEFTKRWIESVKEAGASKLFWDEPHLHERKDGTYACCCDRCKRLYEERYGEKMPIFATDRVREFQAWTIKNYFAKVTEYSHSLGMQNISCLMIRSLKFMDGITSLPYMDNIGIDPYWVVGDKTNNPYEFVYERSRECLDIMKEKNKDSHIWLMTFGNKAGSEDEIYLAAEAAYDAGARTILSWSYRGGEACDYKAANCNIVWNKTGDAMRRLHDRHIDTAVNAYRKKYNVI